MSSSDNKEIEVRFLEVDVPELIGRLQKMGAVDRGEDMLEEIIFYDKQRFTSGEFIRLRKQNGKVIMAYKNHHSEKIGDTSEVETEVGDMDQAALILEKAGVSPFRRQQKKRHTFEYKNVIFDIDMWPKIPPYVELEGLNEEAIREAAYDMGFEWKNVVMWDAMKVIESYGYKVREMRWFTFDRVE